MILVDSTMFLFKEAINPTGSMMREIDTYFDNQIEDQPYHKDLNEITIERLNKFILKEIETPIHDYLFEFKHKDRPDLLKQSYGFFIDSNTVDKTNGKLYRNQLRDMHKIKISWAGAAMIHRGNMIYNGNTAKWVGNLGNLAVFIGVSNEWEHDSKLHFPIQQVSVKLNRGDILVAPSGFTHPFVYNDVVNGVLKLVEAL